MQNRNVFINAGLGNQLFQYSFAHRTASDHEIHIRINVDSQPREDRPFELNSLLEYCKHHQGKIQASRSPIFLGRFRKLVIRLLPSPLSYSILRIANPNFEEVQFEYNGKDLKSSQLIVGYFQHWKYVEESWPVFGPEIQALVDIAAENSIVIRELQSGPKKLVVAHVRRGDLVNLTSTMGVLDFPYYNAALQELPLDRSQYTLIIVTDDVTGSRPIAKLLSADRVLGPMELNPLEALSLMAVSDYVISANSTLSWWGGYLALKRGASAFIPYPWFRNWKPEVGTAFNFEKFTLIPAVYISPGKFDSDFTLES